MLRRSHIITATTLLAVAAAPASAATYEQLHGTAPPPSSIATPAGGEYESVRSPDPADAAEISRGMAMRPGETAYTRARALGASADQLDMPRVHYPTPEVATEPPAPIVTVTASSSGGFDWGDAGIGAAGMVALFGVAGGSALLLLGRKRRREVRVATH
jgi:hypothetical protein